MSIKFLLSRIPAFLVGLVVGVGQCAVNPYSEAITNRNVFALKEPPPPPAQTEVSPPAAKITLIGIANVMGRRKAVLKAETGRPKPAIAGQPAPGQEPPIVLEEGGMLDGISLVSIDERNGSVKVDNNGEVLVLTFERDGLKAPSGAASPTQSPGLPNRQPEFAGLPRPGGMANQLGGVGMGQAGLPSSAPGTGGAGGSLGGIGLPASGGGSLPQREVRAQQGNLTAAEAFVLTEVNREKNDALIKAGILPRMPPPIRGLQPEIGQPPANR